MAQSYLSSHLFESNLGTLLIIGGELGVTVLSLEASNDPTAVRRILSEALEVPVLDTSSPLLAKAAHQISSYLEGERELFSFNVDIKGTPFQRRVWEALCLIPYGETQTYQEVANAIGRPKAVRAVANACGQNPLPLIIPCHRVIASDGSLGGFSAGGLDTKRRLLNLERGTPHHLPLFEVAKLQEDRTELRQRRDAALEGLPSSLADWLRLHLRDGDVNPATRPMTPEAWLAEVLETTDQSVLAHLAESIATSVNKEPNRILCQVAEELVAAALTLALQTTPQPSELKSLLRAAALIDSPFFEVTCRRLLNRSSTTKDVIDEVSQVLRDLLDGSLEASNRLRDRAVDLWVVVEERQPSSVWSAASAEDPSAVYAAHGLWREALIMAENALALGQHDPVTLLNRISEIHETLGELRQAYDATLRLVALSPTPEGKRRLRELADRLDSKDSH